MFTRAWHFSLETCRQLRWFALKGRVREQMAQQTGKDYQHREESSIIKLLVNNKKKEENKALL